MLGVDVAVTNGDDALARVARVFHQPLPAAVNYANAHTLNLAYDSSAYRAALNRSALVLNDGIGLHLAARMRGVRFPENLNGSDFTIRILELAAAHGYRTFLLGAAPGVAEVAAVRLVEQVAGLRVVGVEDGYGNDPEATCARIRRSGADLVLVGMGNPLQELWLDRHLAGTGARVGVGVGAFLDFRAGVVKRAPSVLNDLGIEWLFRLAQEPRRLWARYLVGNPVFLRRTALEALRRRRSSPAPNHLKPRSG